MRKTIFINKINFCHKNQVAIVVSDRTMNKDKETLFYTNKMEKE